ncbi:CapA family protein [Ornithinimicrobium humiphilum]|uniref:Poly-gamma-glutamate synthesis protein (Capsule biosynthesis protein) n=1 Tax=Ornithinimicrobium humiphilum TaxID=125288 RepID=A0A543KQ47_9MICO|nr:CapA family protein [Ornithinimicrobium humiphilum]TQM97200.1 poly-gamma-glutamate synthesis protein (capsule biosynthesis protein) [Ornithinimicrobium humiphilum]
MRTRRAATSLAAAGALLLTGCGGGDVPDATAPPADGSSGGDGTAAPAPQEPTDGETEEPAEPEPAEGPLEITLAATGDILAHSRLNLTANAYAGGVEGAYDYTPMFVDVGPLISAADLALCHMETPVSPDNTNLSIPDTLSFNTPHQIVDALKGAGVDGCDFASNHTMDRGIAGVEATEQVLRDAGLGYAGPTAHEDRAGKAEVYEVPTSEGATARVAHLAYTYTYPNAGGPTTDVPGEAPWLVESSWPNLGAEGILEQASRARDEGADFVVVSMHWGGEYNAQPLDEQVQLAHALLESDDVDLILGTHVHVIQPCDRINGKHVAYGLGNFLSNQSPDTNVNLSAPTQEGMVATFTLRRDEAGTVTTQMQYQPTRVEIVPGAQPGPHVVRLVSPETYPETWARTTATVDALGTCEATPVHP